MLTLLEASDLLREMSFPLELLSLHSWFTYELPQLPPDLPCQESCLGQAVEL